MSPRSCLTVVLAAGEGTRMNSARPKVLHEIAGLPMVAHVARAALAAGGNDVALVTGRGGDEVRAAVKPHAPGVEAYEQTERLGTAHAVLAARGAIARGYDDVLVVFGDTPLVEAGALAAARDALAGGAHVAVMGFRADRPAGYGRLIESGDRLVAIREERDCSDEERRINYCNGGLMAISGDHALALLDAVGNDNAKKEYYLTDIVAIAHGEGLVVVATEAGRDNVLGINNRAELAEAEAIWQARKRLEMMLSGVTLRDPSTVHFSYDTEIAPDTVVEPYVVFGPGVRIESAAAIAAFSHIVGASVGGEAQVGPFARLREGTRLSQKAKVGNFCEIKNAELGEGAKVNHLSYIGDARIGAKANIGAGTITCNYDGFSKHVTEIGAGAYVASGSVITDDVPADALAFGRARQEIKQGRAKALRERLSARK